VAASLPVPLDVRQPMVDDIGALTEQDLELPEALQDELPATPAAQAPQALAGLAGQAALAVGEAAPMPAEPALPLEPPPPVVPVVSEDWALGTWVELSNARQCIRTQLTWVSPQQTLFLFTATDGSTQSMTRRMRDKLLAQGQLRRVD